MMEDAMCRHILIATDGSDLSGRAVRQGLALSQTLQAQATVITVTEPWDAVIIGEAAIVFPPAEYEKTSAANAAGMLALAREMAAEIGVSCETLHVKDRRPAEGIIETAKAKHCDLIVMGSHGRRGISRLVLGSQANEVVSHSTVPVLVCR
jgi:nucleotide-binding universal stress UspA family protein